MADENQQIKTMAAPQGQSIQNLSASLVNNPSLPAGTEMAAAQQRVNQGTFDSQKYLAQNPDVAAAVSSGQFASAEDHYNRHGRVEGRSGTYQNSELMSGQGASVNPNVNMTAAQGTATTANAPQQTAAASYNPTTVGNNAPQMNAVQGSLTTGKFDEASYLAQNPDVAAAVSAGQFKSAEEHFRLHGQQEGRQGSYSAGALAQGAQGQLSPTSQAQAAQGQLSPGAIAQAAQGQLSAGAYAQAAQGTVSKESLATAEQGTAAQVNAPKPREVQQGELVSGSAVDQSKIDQTLNQSQAEQGTVTDEMTVQGQMAKLTQNFDATNPPPWAAGAIRSAMQVMAARGVSASSMAGQAIVQAALESALPIASADAETYKQMGFQNLSNKQAMALQKAQMRAQFLGQEFDQNFQTRVVNAAKISEIANLNFTAEQTIALENARLTQQMNLQNLSNRQAVALANAATYAAMDQANLANRQQANMQNASQQAAMDMQNAQFQQQANLQNASAQASMDQANLANRQQANMQNAQASTQMDLANLSNRQQALMQNAQAFLQMDLSNMDAKQQAAVINQQAKVQTMLSDQAAENAAKQFNAQSQQQTDQFFAELTAQIAQFNTAQTNSMTQSNVANQNDMAKFVEQQRNSREQFNANMAAQIEQSNVQWRRTVNTANTAAINASIATNVQNRFNLSTQAMANLWQQARDVAEYAFTEGENEKQRAANMAIAVFQGQLSERLQNQAANDALWGTVGDTISRIIAGSFSDD